MAQARDPQGCEPTPQKATMALGVGDPEGREPTRQKGLTHTVWDGMIKLERAPQKGLTHTVWDGPSGLSSSDQSGSSSYPSSRACHPDVQFLDWSSSMTETSSGCPSLATRKKDDAEAKPVSVPEQEEQEEKEQKGGRPEMSVGAVHHSSGMCVPCVWWHKVAGCKMGSQCKFCHLCLKGEYKRRKRQQNAASRAEAAAQPAPTSVFEGGPSRASATTRPPGNFTALLRMTL